MVCVAQTALPSVSDISIPVRQPFSPDFYYIGPRRTTGTLYHYPGFRHLVTTYLTA
jgi:hypothetical protein